MRTPHRRYAVFALLLGAVFSPQLYRLAIYAAGSDLHSHILLVPFIAAYLLFTRRGDLPAPAGPSRAGTAVFTAFALAALAAFLVWRAGLSLNDGLALVAFAFAALFVAGGFACFGSAWMAAAAFPFGFLFFMIPLPDVAVLALEQASVVASAEAAALYFAVAGTPLVRHGTVFELPGIVLEVARECSGIRSSWVLFITSALASGLFLRSPWRRFVLVAFVIPLGIFRNGFRVFVIGMLCVHVGPHMVESAIHRQGGPLFFALSLPPLFALLWWLRRREAPGPDASSRP